MVQLIEFPQRQHQEFRRLVFKSVSDAAQIHGIDIEEYISSIYFSGETPHIFSSRPHLNDIYSRFKDLIESTVKSDPDVADLSDPNKVYLCFRVYLHNICTQRQVIPKSEAELYLKDALKEYFLMETKVLRTNDELKILRYINRLRSLARLQPS